MSKLNFKYPFDVEAEDRITGFKGTIIARKESINGAITYGLQPRKLKEDSDYIVDARAIDEGYISGVKEIDEEVEFKFDCGDKVQNFINGFEGTVVNRNQWLNGCIQYEVEGMMIKTDLHGMVAISNTYWEQELEVRKNVKPSKVKGKKRSGGPTTSFCSMEKI